jgi:multidrug efflux pump subunit AcrA (membrane-fusion protein)
MNKHVKDILIASLAIALAGCTDKAIEDREHEGAEAGVTFNVARGLHVPEATAKFIGLRTVDVEERRIPTEFRFSAQVYRDTQGPRPIALNAKPAATRTLASADINAEDPRVLQRDHEVRVQPDSGAPLRGRVVEIAAHAEKFGAHVDVIIAIEDPEGQLRAGSFVTVIAQVAGDKEVVSIPGPALLRTAEGEFVYTVSSEHFVRTAVKAGTANDEHVEITDGLYAGDKVVVHPVMTLWMAELQSIRGGKACADGY